MPSKTSDLGGCSLRSSICWFGKPSQLDCHNCHPGDGVCNHNAIDQKATTKPSCCHIDFSLYICPFMLLLLSASMKIQHGLSGQVLAGSRPNRLCLDAFNHTSFTKHSNLSEGFGKQCHDSKLEQHIVLNRLLQCANACQILTEQI